MYPIELTKEEFGLLRQSLDAIQIMGKSAKFVAILQDKLDEQLFQIDMNIKMEEAEKLEQLVALQKKERAKKAPTT
jgi:predicted ArsR family transcriptional regulator